MPGNLYRRGGIWWGRKQVAGTEHRRSLRTRDRAEAKRRYDTWAKELTAAVHFGEKRLTWKAAVERYTTEIMPEAVKPSTQERYRVSFRQLDPFLRNLYLDQITRAKVAELVSQRTQQGASNATKRRDLTAASQVFEAAMQWEAADRNPFTEYSRKQIKERREPIRPPGEKEKAAVIKRAPGLFSAMIRFLDLVGCREEEAASLEWPEVNLKRREVTFVKTKTSRPRVIRISDAAAALLASLPRALGSKHVFWHGSGERYANVASRFRAIVRSAQESAQKAHEEAGGKGKVDFRPFRCHDLRHGYAIRELVNGRDIYDLSRHLGHSSVKTTEIYLQWLNVSRHENRHSVQRFVPGHSTEDNTASV